MKWTRHLLASELKWLAVMLLVCRVIRQNGTNAPAWVGAVLWAGLWANHLILFQHKESPPEGWIYWLHMGMRRTGLLFSFSGAWAIASFLLLTLILPPSNGFSWLILLFVGLYGVVTFLSWWNFGLPAFNILFFVPLFLFMGLPMVLPWLQAHGFSINIPSLTIVLPVLSGILALLAVWLYVRWLKKDLT